MEAGGARRGKLHEDLGLLRVLGWGRQEAGNNKGNGRRGGGIWEALGRKPDGRNCEAGCRRK